MMDVLLTGSSGYIGSYLTSQNFNSSEPRMNFIGLDKSAHQSILNKTYFGSFCDTKLIQKIFKENPRISHVIHLAALKSAPESLQGINAYYQTNVECTLNFIQELSNKKIKKFIFASSAAVYDYSVPPDDNKLNENSRLGTSSPYGVFKRLVEAELTRFANRLEHIQFQSVRIFNPVGLNPLSHWSNRSDLLSKIAQCVKENSVLEIMGDKFESSDGTAIRDFIPIEDLALGLMKLLSSTSDSKIHEIYNLGTGQETSILKVVSKVNAILDIYNKKLSYRIVEPTITDVRGYAADISKLTKFLGWEPLTSLDLTLKLFIESVVQNDK